MALEFSGDCKCFLVFLFNGLMGHFFFIFSVCFISSHLLVVKYNWVIDQGYWLMVNGIENYLGHVLEAPEAIK